MAAGGAAMVCGLAIPEPDLVRVGALLVILPLVSAMIARRSRYRLSCSRRLDPPRVPAGQPSRGDRTGGERLAAAHRRPAGRGRDAVLAGQQAAVRARRDRAGRPPGAQLPDPVRHPRQVHHRPAAGPGGRRVRAGGDQPVVQHDQHAGGHARRSTRCRGPRRASSWLGEGDGGMRTISAIGEDDAAPRGLPGRRRAAPGALAVDGAVRRADGPPRGTPVAQQRVGVP